MILRWGPAAAWIVLIFVLSHQPLQVPDAIASFDWAAHFAVFGALAVLLAWAVSNRGRRPLPATTLAAVWLACSAYGLLDEWHQSFVPNRVPSARDVIADMAGAFVFVVGAGWVLEVRHRRLGKA